MLAFFVSAKPAGFAANSYNADYCSADFITDDSEAVERPIKALN